MSDDKELLSSGFSDVERDLLRSAELLDVPSEGGKRRARALLTLGAAAAVTLGVSSAAPLATKTALTVGRWTLAKGLLVGAVGLAALGGVFYAASVRSHHPAAASTTPLGATAVIVAPAEPPLSDAVPALPVPEETVSPPAPVVSSSSARGATPASRAVAPAASGSSAGLADEIAALDRARGLLEGGRAAAALSALGDFDRRFPNGALRQEAAVTRIEALFKQGRAAEATSLANRFLAENPASSHAEHLRRLVREAAPSE